MVAVALNKSSLPYPPKGFAIAFSGFACFVALWNVFLRKPELERESPPIRRGLATEPFGAFYLKNSLEAALDELAAKW